MRPWEVLQISNAQLKLQATCAFWFIFKHIVDNTYTRFLEVWVQRFQTAKATSKAIGDDWCHSILLGHVRFSISFPLQMSLSCTVSEILSLISEDLKRSGEWYDPKISHSGVIYNACNSTPQYQSAQCLASPMPSIWLEIQNLKYGSCDPHHAHSVVVCHPELNTSAILTAYKIWRL